MSIENISVQVKEVSETSRDIIVTVPFQHVESALTKALSDVQKQARIKGFRKGKAPIQMVKKMYGQEIESEAMRTVLDESYAQALDQVTLRIVGRPSIKDLDFSFAESKPFSYTASVEVLPEIKPKGYKGLKINVAKLKVADEQIAQQLESIRQSYSELEATSESRPLKFGDFAVLDIDASCEGQEAKELSGKSVMLEMGTEKAIPGFEGAVLGLMPGEKREFDLVYPKDDSKYSLKDVHFSVTLIEMKMKKVPELNDEFVKNLGEFKDLDDLKNKIREELQSSLDDQARRYNADQVIDKLIEENTFEVPAAMVAYEVDHMIQDFRQEFSMRGQKLDDNDTFLEKLREDFKGQAEKRVRAGLLLDAVSRQEGIKVEDGDWQKHIQQLSSRWHKPIEEIERFYQTEKAKEGLKFRLLEEKTLEFLRENAKIIKEIENLAEISKNQAEGQK